MGHRPVHQVPIGGHRLLHQEPFVGHMLVHRVLYENQVLFAGHMLVHHRQGVGPAPVIQYFVNMYNVLKESIKLYKLHTQMQNKK